jgi:hypothetical protein
MSTNAPEGRRNLAALAGELQDTRQKPLLGELSLEPVSPHLVICGFPSEHLTAKAQKSLCGSPHLPQFHSTMGIPSWAITAPKKHLGAALTLGRPAHLHLIPDPSFYPGKRLSLCLQHPLKSELARQATQPPRAPCKCNNEEVGNDGGTHRTCHYQSQYQLPSILKFRKKPTSSEVLNALGKCISTQPSEPALPHSAPTIQGHAHYRQQPSVAGHSSTGDNGQWPPFKNRTDDEKSSKG